MRLASVVFIAVLVLSACSARSGSALPSGTLSLQKAPSVWERGAPPVRWNFINNPDPQVFGTDYSWVVSVPTYVAVGASFLDVDNTYQARTINLNMSASVAGGASYGEYGIVKVVSCNSGNNVCAATGELIFSAVREYSAGQQGVRDLAAGAGVDDVWFTTCCRGSYIAHASDGKVHFYRPPNKGDQVQDVAYSTDGSVWATIQPNGQSYSVLAKLNPATSAVTEYPLHLSGSPAELLSDVGGIIWFAMNKTLYELTTASSAIHRFDLPQTATGYLALAPDNTLWLSYYNSNGITAATGLVNLTKAGKVLSSVQCPSNVCQASLGRISQLTIGPDQNVWFVYPADNGTKTNPQNGIGIYMHLSMDVNPSSVTLSAPGKTQLLSVSETNYTGTWTAASTNTKVVAVTRWTSKNTVLITGVAAGSGRIIIRDTRQNYYSAPVTVQ